jgi:hypothetical protein
MSSLIFITEETQALVATDTLATSPAGEPLLFTTKAFPVPHLRMVIAGTGSAGFLDRWFLCINTRMLVRGIDDLNKYAPMRLPELWAWWWEQQNAKPNTTMTVYHFGLSENTALIHSFAYRSENAFRSDSLAYGIAAKPECTTPDLPIQAMAAENFAEFRRMMGEQRAIQNGRPAEKRVYVGGEIQVHHLYGDAYSVRTIHRFSDFDEDAAVIYKA